MTIATSALPLIAGAWKLDAHHSDVSFTVRHLGISKVRGHFNSFDASLAVGDSLETSSLNATADLSSVDTNNADRDGHLQSTDFFNTETHPQMTFSSSSIVDNGDGEYTVAGTLTINGTAKPVELAVEFNGAEIFPMDQSVHAGFSASATISRSAYGIDFNVPLGVDKVMIGDKVAIELEVQFVQP